MTPSDVPSTRRGRGDTPPEDTGALLLRRYRLGDRISSGGSSIVYAAHDEQLDRPVAVKIFRTDAVTEEEVAQQEREIRLLANLSHHGLVPLLDVGLGLAGDGRPRIYLVMERIGGESLRQRLRGGPLSLRETAYLGFDVAEALEYLEYRKVVHRDIKPGNIMLVDYTSTNGRRRARLIDFGIAQRATATGQLELSTGTAAYLSPEQALGKPVDNSSDIYSLGLVLLECLTGELVFPGTVYDSAAARLVNDPPIPEHLPEGWQDLLRRMTARAPEDRPSPAEAATALRDLVVAELAGEAGTAVATRPATETERSEAVHLLGILDSAPEEAFDRVTALASHALDVPIALVTILDRERAWFKSNVGFDFEEVPRDTAFCSWAILDEEPLVIENPRSDPRTSNNPLVVGDPNVQFYAGVPLRTRTGHNIGALCVFDRQPRSFGERDLELLTELAGIVMTELELRLSAQIMKEQRDALLPPPVAG
ncbi:protein kinase domain-containing protein [Herbiconiux sp. SYSU D00978]|uniref:protein kinase domain-containing protein n=1 Tax=Herbiconiux sp. SYSU D00978 TaxID=2812562 RepID=UPI001A9603C5|nr:protein kinase [Herbiconiux sp. SYSU D00978]